MASKKQLQRVIDDLSLDVVKLEEKIDKLCENEEWLYDQRNETSNKIADLQSEKTYLFRIVGETQACLDYEIRARLKYEKEAAALRGLLEEKQAHLDYEIVARVDSEKMVDTLKEMISTLKVKLCNVRYVLTSIQGHLDKAAQFPV